MNYRDMGELAAERGGLAAWLHDRPQMPYLLPFFAYVLIMAPGALGHFAGLDWTALWRTYHPLIYPAESLAAALLLWALWPFYTRIRWTHLRIGALVGLLGTFVWVGTEYLCQHVGLTSRPNPTEFYIPDVMLDARWKIWGYLCVRVVGPTLVVPVMEELFFRDFLMRVLIRGSHFEDVPVGAWTWLSFLGMCILFGMNHGREWPEGVLYGAMMGVLLIRTKSLGSCIVAHAVTNWTLYLYVIYRGDWQFM